MAKLALEVNLLTKQSIKPAPSNNPCSPSSHAVPRESGCGQSVPRPIEPSPARDRGRWLKKRSRAHKNTPLVICGLPSRECDVSMLVERTWVQPPLNRLLHTPMTPTKLAPWIEDPLSRFRAKISTEFYRQFESIPPRDKTYQTHRSKWWLLQGLHIV